MSQSRIWDTVSELTNIDSPTFAEHSLCDALKERLTKLGIKVYKDGAGTKIGGSCGNLYGFVPGDLPLEPILFSAHMDTVEPGQGKKAVLREGEIITSEGETVLGADDIAGITVILEALARLKESGEPHRPVELLFPVAEEHYGLGSAVAEYDRVASKQAYVLDLGGEIGEAAHAAPTILSFTVTVHGKAAHAGFAPGGGIHAIAVASKSIAQLKLGEISPGTTCNIGKIAGGEANNIIPDVCVVSGEIRSLSHENTLYVWEGIRRIFEEETEKAGASLVTKSNALITAYETPRDSPIVRRFESACKTIGVEPYIHSTMGGSDQNNFTLHGIEGIVIACSMHDVHSTREYSRLDELEQCVRLVQFLISAEEV
jgi:tripeptide aminopeptidase